MVLRNGVDIVKVSRIEEMLMNKRESFLRKVFTQTEKEYIEKKRYNPQTVSGIFAAKEALSKMLGTGIGKINWKDVEVLHDDNGKPFVSLYGEGLKIAKN